MKTNFCYGDISFDTGKYTYDMAMLYARFKMEEALRDGYDFYRGAAPVEVEQIEFLNKQFLFAFEYLSGAEPGDYERALEMLKRKSTPDVP